MWNVNTRILFGGVALAAVTGCMQSFTANAGTIVLPPAFEDAEGNYVHNPSSPYPDRRENRPTPDGFRLQELYSASSFSALGPGPFVISSMAYRPDMSVDEPVSAEWDITALNLSTTTVGSIRSKFEDNYGEGGSVNVLSGIVPLETDGVPRPGGLPHEFDYVFNFRTPYVYDPQQGNLLAEFISVTDLPPARDWHDAINPASPGPKRLALAFAADAEAATILLDEFTVTQFTIAPEAPILHPGDADQDLDFDQLDLVRVQIAAKYLTGQPATWGEGDWNGAPGGTPGNPPTGDGFFDQLDIIAALADGLYLTGRYAAMSPAGIVADPQNSEGYNFRTGEVFHDLAHVPVPEPAAIALLALGLPLVFLTTRQTSGERSWIALRGKHASRRIG
jgi:hypothetical protein